MKPSGDSLVSRSAPQWPARGACQGWASRGIDRVGACTCRCASSSTPCCCAASPPTILWRTTKSCSGGFGARGAGSRSWTGKPIETAGLPASIAAQSAPQHWPGAAGTWRRMTATDTAPTQRGRRVAAGPPARARHQARARAAARAGARPRAGARKQDRARPRGAAHTRRRRPARPRPHPLLSLWAGRHGAQGQPGRPGQWRWQPHRSKPPATRILFDSTPAGLCTSKALNRSAAATGAVQRRQVCTGGRCRCQQTVRI